MKKGRLKYSGLKSLFIFIFFFIFLHNKNTCLSLKVREKPPILTEIPATSFSCKDRPAGYYADIEVDCQVYHMCDSRQKQYSYLCPALTLFNQKFMVCDHYYAVDCSTSTQYYELNKMIGVVPDKRSAKPEDNFIEDEDRVKSKITSVFKFSPKKSINFLPSTVKPDKFSTSNIPRKNFTKAQELVNHLTTKALKLPGSTSHFDTNQIRTENSPSARGSGRKIKFGIIDDNVLPIKSIFTEVNFTPLLKQNKDFFNKPHFTVSPAILQTTTAPSIFHSDINLDSDSEETIKEISTLAPFLIPPHNENEKSIFNANDLFPLNTFLVPPVHGPVILSGQNQEMHTHLSLKDSRVSFSRNLQHLDSTHTLPNVKSNRKFFISSNGVGPSSNISPSSLSKERNNTSIFHPHMTMTFPTRDFMRRRRPLTINPNCPRCHPAFLRPNECHPCVIIK